MPTNARRASGIGLPGCCTGKELAIETIEAEIRSAVHAVWLEASRLVLTGEPIEIARQLRDRAEQVVRPPTSKS